MQRQRDNNLGLKNQLQLAEEELAKRALLIDQLESEEEDIEQELNEKLKKEIDI